jgi:hypothetical protein
MHPALLAQKPALSFRTAADYLDTAGLTGGAHVGAYELLEWAISNNCVSVFLPLRVRARRTDVPAGRIEQIDGVWALVLDDVGRREAYREYRQLAYLDGYTVRGRGDQGATVTRDGRSYELLDPQREDDGISSSMPMAGSALPAHAELVVSREALVRFMDTLAPVVTPVPSASDLEITADPFKDTSPALTPEASAGAPLSDADARKAAVDHFITGCAEFTRDKVRRRDIAAAMRHRTTRQFQYWQAASKSCTPETAARMAEILRDGPKAFVDLLKKRKALP